MKFEATKIYPGRPEQQKFTSVKLHFINREKSLQANSIKLKMNEEYISSINFINLKSDSIYKKNDTVIISFSIQNHDVLNKNYTLNYTCNNKLKNIKLNKLKTQNDNPVKLL